MHHLHFKFARRNAVFSILLKVDIHVISLIFTITPMSYHQSYVCNNVFTANVQRIKETRKFYDSTFSFNITFSQKNNKDNYKETLNEG